MSQIQSKTQQVKPNLNPISFFENPSPGNKRYIVTPKEVIEVDDEYKRIEILAGLERGILEEVVAEMNDCGKVIKGYTKVICMEGDRDREIFRLVFYDKGDFIHETFTRILDPEEFEPDWDRILYENGLKYNEIEKGVRLEYCYDNGVYWECYTDPDWYILVTTVYPRKRQRV